MKRKLLTLAVVAVAFSALVSIESAMAVQVAATPSADDICSIVEGTVQADAGQHGAIASPSPQDHVPNMAMMGEFDLMFIDMMIPHHQEAIDMARVVLERSTQEEIIRLATDIIEAQESEISMMTEWRETWYPGASEADPEAAISRMGGGMMQMNTGEMLSALCSAEDVDRVFVTLMVPHHESAIMMANAALTQAEHPELVELAKAIVETQAAEIVVMEQLLSFLDGTPIASE
ncbi:hypothetical protein BH23CHL5_BH23CHL5_07130 [soil metagenome]